METDNNRPCNRNIRKNLSEWNTCCIFTILDLLKPLNDAQIWGRFIFIPYGHLIWQGLYIPHWDCPCWKTEVGTLGTPNGRSIISETLAINPYRFDKKLRLFLFNDIEKVEIPCPAHWQTSWRGNWQYLLDDRWQLVCECWQFQPNHDIGWQGTEKLKGGVHPALQKRI